MVTDVSFRTLRDEFAGAGTLKREAKSAFTFVSERGAPLHLALGRPKQLRLQTNTVRGTLTLPPCWTGRGGLALMAGAVLARKKAVNLSHRVWI